MKVLHPELAAVIGAERFLAEITTTANLQHPHILGLIDSGEVNGIPYEASLLAGESGGHRGRHSYLRDGAAVRECSLMFTSAIPPVRPHPDSPNVTSSCPPIDRAM